MDTPSGSPNDAPLRICAVLVTYNRKDLLLKAIDSVKRQTRPLDAIMVIDNHSSDGTLELLRERHPDVPVHRQTHNRGSAGGFREALKVGYEQGFDWIWLMDDDIELVPNGLEHLLKYRHISNLIQARRQGFGKIIPLESFWDASSGTCHTLDREISFERYQREWIPVQWCCFEGPLVHRSVVDAVGLPDERYFLSGDDMMFGLAASFATTIIYVDFILLQRQLPVPATVTPLRWYLMLRNRFLVFDTLVTYGVHANRTLFYCSILQLFFWCMRFVLSGKNGKGARWASLKMLFRGVVDGYRRRFGKPAFLPNA